MRCTYWVVWRERTSNKQSTIPVVFVIIMMAVLGSEMLTSSYTAF